MQKEKPQIICIVGPTASGKTSAAIDYAKKHSGYVISADSRQLYRGMNIGTAKPVGKMHKLPDMDLEAYVVEDVPHFMIDIADPDNPLTLADYQEQVYTILQNENLQKHYKTPLLVGGTGLYIQSIVDNYTLPHGEPNQDLRVNLESKDLEELQTMLQEQDPQSYKVIDIQNKRRLIRALEHTLTTGDSFADAQRANKSPYTFILYGISVQKDILHTRINTRVDEMIKSGLIEEVRSLYTKYGKIQTLDTIGYTEVINYLNGNLEKQEAIEQIKVHTRQYAKRQMTWFKRDKRIQWTEDSSTISKTPTL
ncbi:MAG: tRNA (adenosine(37)-N6)-dimethylallyltransferase MiaA [Patescibacteria group bacterium]